MEDIDTIIFDVNETLLDLTPLKESVNRALGNAQAADLWFTQLLHYSLVVNYTATYHDFSAIAAAVFKMNATTKGKHYTEEEIQKILSPVSKLNPYPEVKEVLKKLKNKGFKMMAFSNGKPQVLQEQLNNAGIAKIFDHVLSVEECGKFKPHPAAYKFALEKVGSSAEKALMVAAHGWDIAGANSQGMKTAFIQREGKSLFPLAQKPDLEIKDLTGLLEL
ncbi:haloacid dehalogenase type II [Christiangramia aquimixticola]|uniref:haloacid dehalogenase type II n=1 Tax=Christiangramia aquimixticola TaxID=1697558 RepID=UPI003AA89B38